jgi:DNA-binding response OmpR family regulator
VQGRRILIITRQVAYSVRLEEALEQIGYTVECFASARNAVEEAEKTHFDLAIVDFMVADMVGDEIIRRLRELQPQIAVVVSPDLAIVRALQAPMNLQVVLNLPIKARHIVPRLQAAIRMMNPNASFPKAPPPSKRPLKSLPSKAAKSEWVVDAKGIASLLMEDEPVLSPQEIEESRQLFERMKNQEPPPPSFDESVTVHDILRGLEQLPEGQATREIDMNEQPEAEDEDTSSSESLADDSAIATGSDKSPSLPQRILEEALSGTNVPTPPEGFSLAKFLERVQERRTEPPLQALPSWVKQEEARFIAEPDFLPQPADPDAESAYSASDTYDVLQTPAPDLSQQRTDRLEPIRRSKPSDADEAQAQPDEAPAPSEQAGERPKLGETGGSQAIAAQLPVQVDGHADEYAVAALAALDDADSLTEEDTPFLVGVETEEERMAARFALALADLAQENAAESCILARHGRIIEVRGRLPRATVEQLGDALTPPLTQDKPTRIRYDIELLGTEYVLCSVLSIDDFVLSLLYAGSQNITIMRLQAKRLESAILSVPEAPAPTPAVSIEPEAESSASDAVQTDLAPPLSDTQRQTALRPAQSTPTPPEPEAVSFGATPASKALASTAFTFVWLMGDDEKALDDLLGADLEEELSVQLQALGWNLHSLSVYADAVYLYADIPNDASKPLDYLHALMARSSSILRRLEPSRSAPMWSESYLLLTPGRSLTDEELRDFVVFARD